MFAFPAPRRKSQREVEDEVEEEDGEVGFQKRRCRCVWCVWCVWQGRARIVPFKPRAVFVRELTSNAARGALLAELLSQL